MSKFTHTVAAFIGVVVGIAYAAWCYESGFVEPDDPDVKVVEREQGGGSHE